MGNIDWKDYSKKFDWKSLGNVIGSVSKNDWKSIIITKVTAYHERQLRRKAAEISSLKYFNVQLLGLSGRPHPALLGINDTRQALKFRAHVKLLSGDFPSFEKLSSQQNCGPHCRLCPSPIESTQHILTECRATADIKRRLLPDLLNLVSQVSPANGLLDPNISNHVLTQFLLDPTSSNLSNRFRIPVKNHRLFELFSLSRDWCFAIFSSRTKQLKA